MCRGCRRRARARAAPFGRGWGAAPAPGPWAAACWLRGVRGGVGRGARPRLAPVLSAGPSCRSSGLCRPGGGGRCGLPGSVLRSPDPEGVPRSRPSLPGGSGPGARQTKGRAGRAVTPSGGLDVSGRVPPSGHAPPPAELGPSPRYPDEVSSRLGEVLSTRP